MNNDLIKLIENIYEEDQAKRMDKELPMEELKKADDLLTIQVKKLYKENGLITSREYPIDTINKFAILVQHGTDNAFVESYLKDLIKNGEKEDQKKVPFLLDRVLVSQGKEQVYGLIVSTKKNPDGTLTTIPKPCMDPDNLDKRRAEIGLVPMADYLKQAEELYKKIHRSQFY